MKHLRMMDGMNYTHALAWKAHPATCLSNLSSVGRQLCRLQVGGKQEPGCKKSSCLLSYFTSRPPPRARGPPPTLSWPSPHPYVTAPQTRLGPARRRPGPAASAAERIIPVTKVVKLTTFWDYNFLQQKMPVIHSLATLHRITALTGCSYNAALYNPSRDH